MQSEERIQLLEKGARAAAVSTWVTAILGFVKATIGILSGSIALLADALHSLFDVVTSIAVWIGLKISKRAPSKRFPYGFYRVETLAFLLVSVVVGISGVQIVLESFRRIVTPRAVSVTMIALLAATFSALVSWLLSRYKSRVGRETHSQALLGEAGHSMVDVCSSVLVFIGILGSHAGFGWAEPIAGLLVGLLVVGLGIKMGKDATLVLLDACLKPELLTRIGNIAMEVTGAKGVHGIRARRSGPFVFAEMHIEVDEMVSIDKVAEITDSIEDRVKQSVKELDTLIIHPEPSQKKTWRIALPVEEDEGWDSRISQHFGKSPYFMLVDLNEKKPASWFIVENPAAEAEKQRGIRAAHLLTEHRADAVVTREIGEGPYHVLRDSSIQILDLGARLAVRQVLDAFSRKELRSLIPVERP